MLCYSRIFNVIFPLPEKNLTFYMSHDYLCIAIINQNTHKNIIMLSRMLMINIDITCLDMWWISKCIYLLHFWHPPISYFPIVNIAISSSQDTLFWFVNPSKLSLFPEPWQTLRRKVEWSRFFETRTFFQFSFIEQKIIVTIIFMQYQIEIKVLKMHSICWPRSWSDWDHDIP
jgi:hypothetical protein